MLQKKLLPSKELDILSRLQLRMNLAPQDQLNYDNLVKGLHGEQAFYTILKRDLLVDGLILNDLLLKHLESEFQIDCLLICRKTVYLFEIKNYEGDFFLQNHNWYVAQTKKEIRDPLMQLKRSEFLLRQLLNHLGYTYEIKPYIIFINKRFLLYQAPLNARLIFRPQLHRFIRKINTTALPVVDEQKKLAQQLMANTINKSAYERLPAYDYNKLKKGITCLSCSAFLSAHGIRTFKCKQCGLKERIPSAILRNTVDFNMLFPNKKITTSGVHDWCGGLVSKKVIRGILSIYLKTVSGGRFTHYVFRQE